MSQISIEKELQQAYLEYSLSVIIGRAIPDVRDGLKPVHRRILYAMHELGNTFNRPYKKSARVVGDVIGKYHPHGDAAVYDALVRMAQDFSMREPLVDGQGNFGSLDGDAPAAMRYTEVRMAKLTSHFLADIDKDTVAFRPNYDNTLTEPEVLPTKVPNLLINGSSGIAVGMATNIPPHNLGETIAATIHLLDNPEASIEELMVHLPGPDFPTGALLYGREGLREAYRTGRGSVRMRGRVEVERRKGDLEAIVIREIPYGINKANLVERIAALVGERKIEGVADLRDESDRNGIRIVLDLKRGTVAEVLINQLYKFTPLDTAFNINMLAVVGGRPKLLTLKDALAQFLAHRREVVLRRSRFDLEKAQARAHILEGLRIALDFIDEVVALIRASASPAEAKTRLMERFGLSDAQAQAILDMRLQRLTNLEREALVREYTEVLQRIEYLQSVINNPEVLRSVIREELAELRDTFATPRRSQFLEHEPGSIDVEDIIPDEPVVITISQNGYIKRTSLEVYRQQRRGGTGVTGVQVAEEDFITTLITATTHQWINFFSNRGKMYQLKVHQLPEASRTSRGKHLANLLSLDDGEQIAAAMACREMEEGKFYFFYTRQGTVKRTATELYRNVRSQGLIALSMRPEDELVGVLEVAEDDEMILVSQNGYSIRFPVAEVRAMGRAATGVRGMQLRSGDGVVAGVVVPREGTQELLTVSAGGYGKRTPLAQFRAQSRGGMGIINMRITPRTGPVVGACLADPSDAIVLLTSAGKIIRISAEDISVLGRATQGVRLVRLEEGHVVVAFDLAPAESSA
ncbi:DNA gyrase subunit A [Thermodesulfomicrobium sp. WS]|uniref:DNA gyrase subunit A n=1 Tax=Thermodesulfomicrobium sp. WS TaxID=3004129 RepID=UPI0024928C6D|nr:DNA gyrase subunit A [Thermodesulfomicrobium sp. WS]BDV00509.1 DNA gyrase subunit A [Thermodesulfomicrobium sp. WS]